MKNEKIYLAQIQIGDEEPEAPYAFRSEADRDSSPNSAGNPVIYGGEESASSG